MQIVTLNTQNAGVGETDMCSKLSYYQLKIDCFKHVVCKPVVITKQKPMIDTQRWKERNQSIPLQKIIKSQRKQKREKRTKELQKIRKQLIKMAIISSHPAIITLNENGVNSPIKKYRVAELIRI